MPVKLNTEFNYRYQVIGETVWEKIKTLQGFLEGRVRASKLEEVSQIKLQAKKSRLKYMLEHDASEHECLELEAEIKEIEKEVIAPMAVIIRPGLSSVMEVLSLGSVPLLLESKSDFELNRNREIVISNGWGISVDNLNLDNVKSLKLKNKSIATSGDYKQFNENYDNSHLIIHSS